MKDITKKLGVGESVEWDLTSDKPTTKRQYEWDIEPQKSNSIEKYAKKIQKAMYIGAATLAGYLAINAAIKDYSPRAETITRDGEKIEITIPTNEELNRADLECSGYSRDLLNSKGYAFFPASTWHLQEVNKTEPYSHKNLDYGEAVTFKYAHTHAGEGQPQSEKDLIEKYGSHTAVYEGMKRGQPYFSQLIGTKEVIWSEKEMKKKGFTPNLIIKTKKINPLTLKQIKERNSK